MDDVKSKLKLLPAKTLVKYASKLELKGYTNLKRKELHELVARKWESHLDIELAEALAKHESKMAVAKDTRKSMATVTKELREWVSKTAGTEIVAGFSACTGSYLACDGDSTPVFQLYFAKIKVTHSDNEKVIGNVVCFEKEHNRLPPLGTAMEFKYCKAVRAYSRVPATMPTYFDIHRNAIIITPFDSNEVYKDRKYYWDHYPVDLRDVFVDK